MRTCGFKSHLPHQKISLNDGSQEWRNWQTRRLQVPVVAISCGFKSHLLHFLFAGSLESEGFPFFYFIGNTVIHSCVKVEPSYEIKNAPRGCAARGKENIALRTACARRISQARFFFYLLYSIYCKINSAAFSIPIFPVSIQRSYSLPSPQRVAVHCS